MSEYYIETAKQCPKCKQMSLFFYGYTEKISEREYKWVLGVRCSKCSYTAPVKQEVEK